MAASERQKPVNASEKRVFSRGFRRGIIIYTLLFILAGAVLLLLLWNYLDSYERSQSQTVIEDYCSSLTPDAVTDILMTSSTGSVYEDVREFVREDYALPFCEADKSYIRDINESDKDHVTYIVSGAGMKLLRVTLESEKGGAGFGRNLWKVKETVPAEGCPTGTHSIQCAVPENAVLMLNVVYAVVACEIVSDLQQIPVQKAIFKAVFL